jgi:hypothetical protein
VPNSSAGNSRVNNGQTWSQYPRKRRENVHVVFKYLSGSLLWGGVGRSNAYNPHHHPISYLVRGFSLKDDVTVILLLSVLYFMGATSSPPVHPEPKFLNF